MLLWYSDFVAKDSALKLLLTVEVFLDEDIHITAEDWCELVFFTITSIFWSVVCFCCVNELISYLPG